MQGWERAEQVTRHLASARGVAEARFELVATATSVQRALASHAAHAALLISSATNLPPELVFKVLDSASIGDVPVWVPGMHGSGWSGSPHEMSIIALGTLSLGSQLAGQMCGCRPTLGGHRLLLAQQRRSAFDDAPEGAGTRALVTLCAHCECPVQLQCSPRVRCLGQSRAEPAFKLAPTLLTRRGVDWVDSPHFERVFCAGTDAWKLVRHRRQGSLFYYKEVYFIGCSALIITGKTFGCIQKSDDMVEIKGSLSCQPLHPCRRSRYHNFRTAVADEWVVSGRASYLLHVHTLNASVCALSVGIIEAWAPVNVSNNSAPGPPRVGEIGMFRSVRTLEGSWGYRCEDPDDWDDESVFFEAASSTPEVRLGGDSIPSIPLLIGISRGSDSKLSLKPQQQQTLPRPSPNCDILVEVDVDARLLRLRILPNLKNEGPSANAQSSGGGTSSLERQGDGSEWTTARYPIVVISSRIHTLLI
ncbi:hypothetical protein T492DRAFT_284229 [Pavlovales sp. CCMP2436]|nr:hypothetical protein T492DRAFT_284229 [Pavlovales sp. CCMP2436]